MTLFIGKYTFWVQEEFVKLYNYYLCSDFHEAAIMYVLNETNSKSVEEVCEKCTRSEVFRIIMEAAREELQVCGIKPSISEVEKRICETQGALFHDIAKEGYDFLKFVKAYMSSNFCKREMNSDYSCFQNYASEELKDILLLELGEFEKYTENKRFMEDVAYWIGYFYLELSILTKLGSHELYEILPLKDACRYYSKLSTKEMDVVIDVVCEEKHLMRVFAESEKQV